MSERPKRAIHRFDYKVYSKTGKKVLKGAWEKLSGIANVIDDEMKIICKINRFMKEYGLELLFDIEDIDEGIKELRTLIEKYESVHVALKREFANEYAETYKDYDKNISMMI